VAPPARSVAPLISSPDMCQVRPALAGAAYVRRCLRALLTPDTGASCPVAGASPSSASRARIARRAPSESPAASAASRAARCTAVACTRGLAAVSVEPSRSCRESVARPAIAGLRSAIGSVRPPRSGLTPAVSCSIGSISSHPEGDASRPPLRPIHPPRRTRFAISQSRERVAALARLRLPQQVHHGHDRERERAEHHQNHEHGDE
jgi:hypothetical protein